MSDYPQELAGLAQYLQIATTFMNGEPGAMALSYWARWTWVKKAGEIFQSEHSTNNAVRSYLVSQIDIISQIKQASPVIAGDKGKQLAANFVASERKRIMFMEQRGDWSAVLSEYQSLLQYLDIIIYTEYQADNFRKIELSTKKRMKEIINALQNGQPVPANMSQSMAASNVRAEMAREPSMPSILSMPQPFQPQQQFSMPQQQFSMPQQQFSMPQQQSSMPQQQFSMPQQQSSMPQQQFSMPQQQSSMPQQQSSMPQQQFSMPQQQSSMPQQFTQAPTSYEHHWDGQLEKMIGVYFEVANSMKQSNPNVAKAIYETMARECRKVPQYANYVQAYEAEANKL